MNIDANALQKTKEKCHVELNNITKKYNTNHDQIIKRFLRKDFHFFLWISLIGIILVLLSAFSEETTTVNISILLFAIIGSIGIGQYIKDDYFQTKDMLSIGYLNQGRSFLYMSLLITFFEIMTLFLLLIFLPIGSQHKIAIILCAAFPVFLSQVIAIFFIEYISHLFGSVIVYFLSFTISSLIFLLNDLYLLISLQNALTLIIGIFMVYILTIIIVYKQKEGRAKQWN